MSGLTLHGARNNKGVPWTIRHVKVTDLHAHAHDLSNAVRLTWGRGGGQCRQDDSGHLLRGKDRSKQAGDIGFRLWDPDKRRQPAKPKAEEKDP